MGSLTASRLLSLIFLVSIATSSSTSADRRTYIIHMDKSAMPAPFTTLHGWYTSSLSSLSSTEGVKEHEQPIHLYTYNHVMDGFSAVLSPSQLDQLEKMPGHLATYPETFGHHLTTQTPKFLGLRKHAGLWPVGGFGDDVIIGVIDTGVWPESESFNDHGMPPVPERWGGTCETGVEFNSSHCNRKLIGARSFSKGRSQYGLNISNTDDYDSPRDFMGHGTHTSSTAGGNWVKDAQSFGYGRGTAVGIAPMARLAMYKVLFFDQNETNDTYDAAATDTLAGIDQAIADGVDMISLSLAFFETPFEQNPIALGTFAAMERGIFVACGAGNDGPHAYTILNGSPWFTSIGAGTVDREFAARVTLGVGDGSLTATGRSLYPESLFVDGVAVYFGHGNRSKEICDYGTLDPKDVAGKVIFCDSDDIVNVYQQLDEFYRVKAAGAIFSSDSGQFLRPNDFNLPIVVMLPKDGDLVKGYLIKTVNSTVDIKFQITILGTKPAPQVAFFSSRGPDRQSPWILKPDILAPGVDILAAWVPNRARQPIGYDDYLTTDYAILSGTSMSTPHAIGVAALLKSAHKDWSPAAIRSAMMTTADVLDNAYGPIIDMTTQVAGTPLDYGSGHVNPNKAMNPGLVYDVEVQDYINYLCGLNYTEHQIRMIRRGKNFTCEEANLDLNYPSFMIILNNTNTTSYTFKRVLTNVVDSKSVYRAVVKTPSGMKVVVQPEMISFPGIYSKAEFNLTANIDLGGTPLSDYIGNYGFLIWYEVNGKHVVTSPIVSAFAA